MSTSINNHQLAVIVPAYKPRFLAKAVASLLSQSDQRFGIYVCDDAGPEQIGRVTHDLLEQRPHVYKRFDKNLGGTSIARHWNRCLELITEPWVLIFSDDDMLEPDCIKGFYEFLSQSNGQENVLRFDGLIIDHKDEPVELLPTNLDRESWVDYAYGMLMGWRSIRMQQLIIRRAALQGIGGFVDFPLGWSTDDATLILLTREQPVRRMVGGRLLWRTSDINITPGRSIKLRSKKVRAVCQFLAWLQAQLVSPRVKLFPADEVAFRRAMDRHLITEIVYHGFFPTIANWQLVAKTRKEICHGTRASLLRYMAVAGLVDSINCVGRAAQAALRRGRVGKAS